MRVIRDRTQEIVRDYDKKRSLDGITTIMVHRIGVGESALTIADWFREHGPDWIGTRSMPYHFIITRSGATEQALPLVTMAPHARKWNRAAVAVGLVGDFRVLPPTPAQIASFTILCARIQDRLGRTLRIVGHTEVPNSTGDTSKVCPGKLFPLTAVRDSSHSMGHIVC